MSGTRRGGRVEETGVVDLVVGATVLDGLAGEERPEDLDRFFQHLPANRGRWPTRADDVLVQRLPRAEAEEEPAVEEQRGGGGGLGDDGGMHANDRARHAHADLDPIGAGGDGSEHAPHEGAVTLRAHPRVVVVGDRREVEADRFGAHRVARRAPRGVLLAGERVAEGGHDFFGLLRGGLAALATCGFVLRGGPALLRVAALARLLAAVLRRVGELAILAARAFDMPFFFRASYCFSFLTFARLVGMRRAYPRALLTKPQDD